ncbi:hypothetical protein D8771_26535 [Streptomyces albus]|uniref:Uncharacterized protein n=1 Tax=Streptomyces albus TaxID=1888 RepID=A0A8H1L5U3_9ACTN|nr:MULTISPECIES: hypothetical protein [Streptomyces]TGG77858.1 hypothetical protein D8771_26535 [Streptomyces albus]TXJ73561.1 hypothetical protein E2C11_29045 [Streptomyces lavendulae]
MAPTYTVDGSVGTVALEYAMPKNQSTASKRARLAAREGEKFTAARRLTETGPEPDEAARTYTYIPTDEAGDDHVWARLSEDCRDCPCHAARVCADGLWHLASRPAHADGTAYTDPCPCEEAARVPEPRLLTITFKGITRTLEAKYHRHGMLRGHLRVLGYPFWAEPEDGSAGGRCGMVLTRSKVMRTARDDHGDTWLVRPSGSVGGRPATITGWWSPETADASAGPRSPGAPSSR